jgi:hypothetical protein
MGSSFIDLDASSTAMKKNFIWILGSQDISVFVFESRKSHSSTYSTPAMCRSGMIRGDFKRTMPRHLLVRETKVSALLRSVSCF